MNYFGLVKNGFIFREYEKHFFLVLYTLIAINVYTKEPYPAPIFCCYARVS